MRIAHTALWTHDLDAAVDFWKIYFGATVGEPYRSQRRPGFVSRFISLPGSDDRIELMTGPWLPRDSQSERVGWDHIAISLGSKAAVDALAEQCRADDCLKSAPRTTGDGFYEAVITMPDGTPVEITR
ncbi:glyoxalase/bleomycin resistance/extradiol dioxygenase family protein [Rhizobium sp. JAB6]|uniref:VOC family protein n=1 Tax=Rhizobium sp. JAB6 TaxID=2127050 RepID=UPI000D136EF6|nr:VOC family protein [Rhizobium sp. JAB6]PST19419.1 glyoxalase/bleomycin resistance/extradiol dioxygenase family protein [Rhizobium sp. JAB6]